MTHAPTLVISLLLTSLLGTSCANDDLLAPEATPRTPRSARTTAGSPAPAPAAFETVELQGFAAVAFVDGVLFAKKLRPTGIYELATCVLAEGCARFETFVDLVEEPHAYVISPTQIVYSAQYGTFLATRRANAQPTLQRLADTRLPAQTALLDDALLTVVDGKLRRIPLANPDNWSETALPGYAGGGAVQLATGTTRDGKRVDYALTYPHADGRTWLLVQRKGAVQRLTGLAAVNAPRANGLSLLANHVLLQTEKLVFGLSDDRLQKADMGRKLDATRSATLVTAAFGTMAVPLAPSNQFTYLDEDRTVTVCAIGAEGVCTNEVTPLELTAAPALLHADARAAYAIVGGKLLIAAR